MSTRIGLCDFSKTLIKMEAVQNRRTKIINGFYTYHQRLNSYVLSLDNRDDLVETDT